MPHTTYLGLGTNLGQLSTNLDRAITALEEHIGTLLKCSSYIETAPWGYESSNKYLNAVAAFQTNLTPTQLLNTTQEIERQMGRTTKSTNRQYHDRIIDIDILFYDNIVITTPTLTIPHPLITQRQFVLQPLAEIAPTFTHPVLHKTIAELHHAPS